MKIYHHSDVDYLSIDFKDEVESKSEYKDGIIVRYDNKGHVIGIDITDSMKLFSTPFPRYGPPGRGSRGGA